MRLFNITLLAAALTVLLPGQSNAKAKVAPKAYLYGFIGNFTDSVVYFTDIQEVDSVWYDEKTRFLIGRSIYSSQLRDYFTYTLKKPNRTCITVFALTRKEAEKKYLKLKKQYTAKNVGKFDVHTLDENEFKFHSIELTPEELGRQSVKAKTDKKKTKKAKDGRRPPRPRK